MLCEETEAKSGAFFDQSVESMSIASVAQLIDFISSQHEKPAFFQERCQRMMLLILFKHVEQGGEQSWTETERLERENHALRKTGL